MKTDFIYLLGQNKPVAYLESDQDLEVVWQQLSLPPTQPVVVIVGGAGGMSSADIAAVQSFFELSLIPLVKRLNGAVIDGGTDAGVMAAIGRARSNTRAEFPLVGVVVKNVEYVLEPNHTHFILTPGTSWGDESQWIAQVASRLAGSQPSATILLNGGSIAWQDVEYSVRSGRPVLVAEGSGRTADVIANTTRLGDTDPRAIKLIRSGLVHVANPFKRPDEFLEKLKHLLKL